MLREAARRIAVLSGAVVAVTVLASALLGLVSGGSIQRAIAVGFYVAGATLLAGCFVTGVRGPLRGVSKSGETASTLGTRRVRRATPDERTEATRTAILLFFLGLFQIVLGGLFDPTRSLF